MRGHEEDATPTMAGGRRLCCTQRPFVAAKAVYGLMYGGLACMNPFLPVLYTKVLGLTATQSGLLRSVWPLVSIVCAPLWGAMADKTGRHREAMAFGIFVPAVVNVLIVFTGDFAGAMVVTVVAAFLASGANSIVDASVMSMLAQHNGAAAARVRALEPGGVGSEAGGDGDGDGEGGSALAVPVDVDARAADVELTAAAAHDTGGDGRGVSLSDGDDNEDEDGRGGLDGDVDTSWSASGPVDVADAEGRTRVVAPGGSARSSSGSSGSSPYGSEDDAPLKPPRSAVADAGEEEGSIRDDAVATPAPEPGSATDTTTDTTPHPHVPPATGRLLRLPEGAADASPEPVDVATSKVAGASASGGGGGGETYGTLRMWGAVSWGSVAPLAGLLIDATGHVAAPLPVYVVVALACAMVALRFPTSPTKTPKGASVLRSAAVLCRDPEIALFLGCVYCMGTMMGVIANFLFLFLLEIGGTGALLGLSLTFTCIAEVPVFFFSGRAIARFGEMAVLLCALVAYLVRLVAYQMLTDPWWVLPVELLHGVTFGAGWAACTSFAHKVAPPGMGATVQGVVYSVHWGLGSGGGAVLGGLLWTSIGSRGTFRVTMGAGVLGIALFLSSVWLRRRHESRRAACGCGGGGGAGGGAYAQLSRKGTTAPALDRAVEMRGSPVSASPEPSGE